MKCTVTLGFGKSPAVESAEAASRGREVRIMEEAIVRGRSGSLCEESGMADWGSEEDIFAVFFGRVLRKILSELRLTRTRLRVGEVARRLVACDIPYDSKTRKT